jgi:nicotinamide-nucleotide amidase
MTSNLHDLTPFEPEVLALAEALRARRWMLVAAESCTGGLIAATCTSIAGSSDWFERGLVTYSNESKIELLGVDAALVARHGAVSEAVVRAMVDGALARSRADLAIAVTGIAGPGGGSPDKPVGTVWLGVGVRGAAPVAWQVQYAGDRRSVRDQTVRDALRAAVSAASTTAPDAAAGSRPGGGAT